MIVLERLRPLVPSEVELIVLETVGSTNDYAKTMASNGISKDLCVIANEQVKGRGTRGRSFYSPGGSGLYLSYATNIKKTDNEIPPTPAVAVAVARAVQSVYNVKPEIKWVNDVLICGRKICGILTEKIPTTYEDYDSVVIGVGVNISTEAFPEEIKDRAASISEFADVFEVEHFAAEIIGQIRALAINPDPDKYMSEYKAASSVLGRRIAFVHDGIDRAGIAKDITQNGHLLVETCTGVIELFSGEVSVMTV
ncbi:MAG: biotin--[acetyl-CoA-carboxylase] ligase [Oscillospiraceae bacterium]|nr:biotin--[acetyl-CoA-carboxylase] ligase [Oscillospiraceae bacterium]